MRQRDGVRPGRAPPIAEVVGGERLGRGHASRVAALAWTKILPALAAGALAILLLRAALGLTDDDPGVTAKRIGIRETALGALTVALIAAGHMLG